MTDSPTLQPHGYATGQFGKNHLGDRAEHLPTMHGFNEFLGNLYHLNAEEEPEQRDYPSAKLAQLDALGIAEDTIVFYSTDNGPHMNSWPDGGMTPFRNEKNSNWEGAFRVPGMVRWPGKKASRAALAARDWLTIEWLPKYAPELNDIERSWRDLKGHLLAHQTFADHGPR